MVRSGLRLWAGSLLLAFMVPVCLSTPCARGADELSPELVPKLIQLMSFGHLKKPKLDAKMVQQMLDSFLARLDPTHTIYLQDEADAKTKMTDEVLDELVLQIKGGNLSYFSDWIREFRTKHLVRDSKYFTSLVERKKEIQAKYNEKDYKDIKFEEFPKTNEEREKRTLLRAKYFYRMYRDYLSEEEAFKYAIQTLKQIREKSTFDPETDGAKVVMKAYMSSLDPHSEYLDAKDIENFESSMARSFAGIGVQIRGCPLGAQVVDVIKGGPAIKSKCMHKGDQIIMVDGAVLAGESLSQIVKRIKGKKGTDVKLTLKKAKKKKDDAPRTETVVLTRDTIDLTELRVKGERFETKAGPVGVIRVESFYQRVADDVSARMRRLSKPTPLVGLVLDLRRNSGGLLKEAIKMVGLFITQGPVVAERDSSGQNHWNHDDDDSIEFTGPLVVLVNQFSASASEIVAGSLQDYGRAVIVGPSQTHGKGTVQRIVDLRRQGVPGQFKLTIRQYFLAGGDSVQKRGVLPDITVPGGELMEDFLERHDKGAIEWDRIEAQLKDTHPDVKAFAVQKNMYLPKLVALSKERVAANKDFDVYRVKEDEKKVGAADKKDTPPGEENKDPKVAEGEKPPVDTKKPEGDEKKVAEGEKPGEGEEKELKDPQRDEAVKIVEDMVDLWAKNRHAVAKPPEKAVDTK